jgi:hypothetical protein
MMPFLWKICGMTPNPLNDPNRKLHEIDEHIRLFVTEESGSEENDKKDLRVLVTDKEKEDYNCSTSDGIFSSHNAMVFGDENLDLKAPITYYLRKNFCACNNCLKATIPEDYNLCIYIEDFGTLMKGVMTHKILPPQPTIEKKTSEYIDFLGKEGVLIDGERIIVRIRGSGVGYLTSLPEIVQKKCSKTKGTVKTAYHRGDVIVTVDMLMRVPLIYQRNEPIPDGYIDYIKNKDDKNKTVHFSEIILPPIGDIVARQMLTPFEILKERISQNFIVRIKSELFESLLD